MSKLPWKPWHEVVELRDDLRSGELSLAMFAADLHAVVRGEARTVYQEPGEFFALTYPTFNLRELAKEVVLRLAGKSERAVRQLELTYGGGKTHALITLYHLVNDPESLPDLPAVNEFREHIGVEPPRARIATLTFDKLDERRGMAAIAPGGRQKSWLYPWTILAWQLAGERGLRALGMDGGVERETQPAENVLRELLEIPLEDGHAPLVLIDEVLMWARTMAGVDRVWRDRLRAFFQCLTQAATKVDRCAVVASLLATDPHKSDKLGKEITGDLCATFRREKEEAIQPVEKKDVAEILRRRFFTPESISDHAAFRTPVLAALKGLSELDDDLARNMKSAEERFLSSYPFHPDLTDVLYAKWTQLEGFQRTRGVLRTFALALREAEQWDDGPLVGPNVFLSRPDTDDLSGGAGELTKIAEAEEYEGKRQEWSAILGGELEKARQAQSDFAGLEHRELEQAVMATFLHSQPIGQKAQTRELVRLIGATRPDSIDLQKGLAGWANLSWFLDEATVSEGQEGELPGVWRLGSRPNLRQMHHQAWSNVPDDLVEARLIDEIQSVKSLTEGARGAGARVHTLPSGPRDIQDDGNFHYAVLGPKAASASGQPGEEACRYIKQTTGPDRPRVYRNAVVLAVPSRDGLEAARNAIRDHVAWQEVQDELKDQEIDPIREGMLSSNLGKSRRRIADTIRQAYCIVVTVSEKNEVVAFRVTVGEEPLFKVIKDDRRSRIQDTAVSAEALLPEGPYDLWSEGEESRRFQDLVGAFAQMAHLPKMLHTEEILDTLVQGAADGLFVLRLERPDRTVRTFWMEGPDEAARNDTGLEVVLPEAAELAHLKPALLEPGALPGLWEGQEIRVGAVCAYFGGGTVVQVERHGFEEPLTIPKAPREVVFDAVEEAVEQGRLWLTAGPASICGEEVPTGLLTEEAVLQGPPAPVPTSDLLPDALPQAWEEEETTAYALAAALSQKLGKPLPWGTVRGAIQAALRGRALELTEGSEERWPCEYEGAKAVRLQIPKEPPPAPPPPPLPADVKAGEADLAPAQLQDLADIVGEIVKISAGHELTFHLNMQIAGDPPGEVVAKLNELLTELSDDLQLT